MNNLPKEYYIDFDTLKVGDKVWHLLKNKEVQVEQIITASNYPIKVSEECVFIGKDGKHTNQDVIPIIFAKNPFDLLNKERVILVKDHKEVDWVQRVLIAIKGDYAICWEEARSVEEAENHYGTYAWNFWKELPEPKELTLEEKFKELEKSHMKLVDLVMSQFDPKIKD